MEIARVLREVRLMRFEEVYDRRLGGRLMVCEAADILGIDEKTFRRWNRRSVAISCLRLKPNYTACAASPF